ncbi:MAG: Lon protease [candidate division WS6 bacterium GW2011_GWF1_35_23]|uniref:Lon protease n=1 Tax=candidate division WS6 bacterium GW2011_GWF1_35_23 TaxID=1619097 RepID=A0A0G0C8V7_9BACT|nr:MAG: Lon protease [candidate division WS6 bacterium GW2011_GWF1_35_23]
MNYSDTNFLQNNTGSMNEDSMGDILALENKLVSSNLPLDLKEETAKNLMRLKSMAKRGVYGSEFDTMVKYVNWITKIPFGALSKDNLDISNAKRLMDETHYGMDSIKDLILDYLAAMQLENMQRNRIPTQVATDMSYRPEPAVMLKKNSKAPVFLFIGLQGVGKTSVAESIANAMGRKFARISLGAIGDVRTLRGTPKYAIDSEPGQLVKSLIRCGTMNPVILLDEIEKASGSTGILNDVMAALLEILDPEQNGNFVDHYLDYPIDLSNVFFICTANNLGGLSAALLDRVEIIRFTSYSDEEKEIVAKKYILPKVLQSLQISGEYIRIDDNVWPMIIRPVGFDAGIRQLERNIATIVRRAARIIIEGKQIPVVITQENLKQFLNIDQGPLS